MMAPESAALGRRLAAAEHSQRRVVRERNEALSLLVKSEDRHLFRVSQHSAVLSL